MSNPVTMSRRGDDMVLRSNTELDPNTIEAWVQKAMDAENARQLDPNTVIAERDGHAQYVNLPEWELPETEAPLTFVIITSESDRDRYLHDCIASLPAWADVVVAVTVPGEVESVSVPVFDGRVATVTYTYAGSFDFGRARNVAMNGVTTPWVLHLDADERLLEAHHGKLYRLLQLFHDRIGGAYVTMIGHHIGQTLSEKRYAFPIMRLHRNDPLIYWVFSVHEQLAPSVADAGYQDADTDVVVLHEGYQANKDVLLEKFDRNLKAMIAQYNVTPNQFFLSKISQTVLAAYRLKYSE